MLLNLLSGVVAASARAQRSQPSAALPARYRDFKVYATSEPDAGDAAQIRMTVQFHNEGRRPLKLRARLNPSARAGFAGGTHEAVLPPHTVAQWKLAVRPPDNFQYEVLQGDIAFASSAFAGTGKDGSGPGSSGGRAVYVMARDLYVALQGPDPAGATVKSLDGAAYWEGNIGPDPAATQRQTLRFITARAEVVGAYAPRVTDTEWKRRAQQGLHPGQGLHSQQGLHPRQPVKPVLTLAAAGRTRYRIVVEPMPRAEDGRELTLEAWGQLKTPRPGEPELVAAIGDLQYCLRLMSGATLPVTGDRSTPGPAVRLRINDKRTWSHPDAFHLFTRRNELIIESGHVDGLRQGIYSLLTDHLDCHWFLPGQLGEEIPRPANRTVVLGPIDEERKPTFFSVGGMSGGAHRDWDRRNRSYINRGRMSFGHAWHSLVNPAEFPYDKFPDMWARDRAGKIRKYDVSSGWSFTNFCTTSPQVLEVVARKVNARLSHPDALVASIDPNDYSQQCLCDRCLALDARYGVTQQDGTYVTDRLLHFSREIYNRLDPQNRDKYLGILVYAYQMELPNRAVPHRQHTGIVCNMDWVYDHTRPFNDPTSPQNREFYRQLTGWSKLLPTFGFYDYYGHYRLFGPWGMIHKMREDLPAFRDLGGTYLMIEAQPNFAMHGLNLYIASRLAWDADADVDALVDEFCARFYGPAAEPMRTYWQTIERRYALARPGPDAIDRVTANPALWQELDGYLKQAEARVAGADKRFVDRILFHRDGFEWGRRQYEFIRLYNRRDAGLEAAPTLAYLGQTTQWLNQMKQKYVPSQGYWPTLVAPYFYSGTEEKIAELEAKLKTPATAP